MRVRTSVALLVGAVVLVGACSDDTDEAATITTEATTTTTTTDVSPSPPEPGEPNTASVVFEDGETATVPVTCDFDPEEDFLEFTATSKDGDDPYFDLTTFNDGQSVSAWASGGGGGRPFEGQWEEVWLVSPTEGSLEAVQDPSDLMMATGVFLEADLTEAGEVQFTNPDGGQPLTTGVERAAAFTVVCAE